MAIVYRHRRLDTNKIFYIGIGKEEKRAYRKDGRNNYWNNIINKTDYNIEIIAKDIDWETACELEIFLISEYGIKNLSNITLGGEGNLGNLHSIETKKIMSEKKIGKPTWNKGLKESKESVDKRKKNLIEYYKNNISHFKDKEFSLEHKKKLSISNSKKCIDKITNIEYYGLKEGCRVLNIDYNNQKYLLRKNSNKSRFIWVL
mgnify:CR=1 FL=1|jgi:hypothetical protein